MRCRDSDRQLADDRVGVDLQTMALRERAHLGARGSGVEEAPRRGSPP